MKWLKLIIGIELLPLCYAVTWTFFETVAGAGPWKESLTAAPFLMFLGGFALWMGIFFCLPKPMRVYVFGHELTHAVWAICMGGRVSSFKVGADGGYVVTDKVNFWISLAPYFFPIYTVILMILWGIAHLIWDLNAWVIWLYFMIGLTYSFHVTFTAKMIPTVQPDITSNGWLFSLVIIYLMNLLSVWLFLVAVHPALTWKGSMQMLGYHSLETYEAVLVFMMKSVRDLWTLIFHKP
ncbi:MAG: M50 family metallopeptidase [Verrucomicrobiae bacterium]|nr:M50 family metallopeptidase [Verrucomicrobiae bacterium]